MSKKGKKKNGCWVVLYHKEADHEVCLSVQKEFCDPLEGVTLCFVNHLMQSDATVEKVVRTLTSYYDIKDMFLEGDNTYDSWFGDEIIYDILASLIDFCRYYDEIFEEYNSKPVVCYNPETQSWVEYASVNVASEATGISADGIRKAAQGMSDEGYDDMEEKYKVIHIDGNLENNDAANLRWVPIEDEGE